MGCSELVGGPETTPVPAMDAARRVDLAHHHGFAGAHGSLVQRPEQSPKDNATSIPAAFLHVSSALLQAGNMIA
jgi:hypothetical protein